MDRLESMRVLVTAVESPTHSRLTVNTAEAAIAAAIAGIEITRVLSYQVAEAIKARALVTVLQEFEPPPSPVSAVFAGQRLLPLKQSAFLDFATPRLRAALPRISADEFAGRKTLQKTRRERGRR